MQTHTHSIPLANSVSRRAVLLGGTAAALLAASPSWAINAPQAEALIDRVVLEINAVIQSGASESRMIRQFEGIFAKYADLSFIVPAVLGRPARNLSSSQLNAFGRAFQGFISRKYGKRFREFIGGEIRVQNAAAWKSGFEVDTTVFLRGQSPVRVVFRVYDRNGKALFRDMIIEGISLLKSEAIEIRALLEERRGDVARLTSDLQRLG